MDEDRLRLDILRRFVDTDYTGGSPTRLAMRSFWDARVRPAGDGLAILGPALSAFVSETALGVFHVDTGETARAINDGQIIGELRAILRSNDQSGLPDLVMKSVSDPDDAYAYMTETPLQAMDPAGRPRDWAGVLYVKGRRPLLALRELLGPGFATAIAGLPSDAPLTWERFRAALLAAARPEDQERVAVLLDNWLSGTDLPGFVVEEVRTWRLSQEPERWQVVATVRNDGSADGLARFVAGKDSDATPLLVTVPKGGRVEAGVVVPRRLEAWRLEPFLALNRIPPTGSIVEAEAPEGLPELAGLRDAPPSSARARVVVDNLDAGFTVTHEGKEVAFAARDDEGDRILGKWQGWNQPRAWKRWRHDGRWSRPFGTFDETAALKRGTKEGVEPATWRADLPAGQWRVETWLPPKVNVSGPDSVAELEYVIVHAGGEDAVKLTPDEKISGWSDLGRFRFSGPAEVRLLDKGDGLVVADAVRFTKEAE